MAVTAGRCGCAQLRRDTNLIGIAASISALTTGGELPSLGRLKIRYLHWSEGKEQRPRGALWSSTWRKTSVMSVNVTLMNIKISQTAYERERGKHIIQAAL